MGDGNYFITRADPAGTQRQLQRSRPARHADTVGRAAISGKLRFKGRDIRPHNKLGRGNHPLQRLFNLLLDRRILRL